MGAGTEVEMVVSYAVVGVGAAVGAVVVEAAVIRVLMRK